MEIDIGESCCTESALDQNSIENGQKSTAQDDLGLINCGIIREDSTQIFIMNGTADVEIFECLPDTRTWCVSRDYTKSSGGHVWAKPREFPEEFRIGPCEQNKGDPQGSLGVFGNNLTQVCLCMDNCTAVLTSAHSHSLSFLHQIPHIRYR